MKENTLSYTTRIGKTTFIVNVKQSERALKILMLGFVFSIVYHGMAKFLNKIFGVVNNKNNENT